MIRFARLVDALAYHPEQAAKARLIADYLRRTPDPDRGYALAALTGGLALRRMRSDSLRTLADARLDPTLFAMSLDYVGDVAETLALSWPAGPNAVGAPPTLSHVVETYSETGQQDVLALIAGWLDRLDSSGRLALLKLVAGSLRPGISPRLGRMALADAAGATLEAVEAVWHGCEPPYRSLFAWLFLGAAQPQVATAATFLPPMRALTIDEDALAALNPTHYRAEWKWDGLSVQLAADPTLRRIFSHDGEDISAAFPEIVAAMSFSGVLEGELLIARRTPDDIVIAPFSDLQQRLARRTASSILLEQYPAHVRLYDMLFDADQDLRPLSFDRRRARLEAWYAGQRADRFDVSPLIDFASWAQLAELRRKARPSAIEGLILKRRDSAYAGGPASDGWLAWPREAGTVDAVLMYAERGRTAAGAAFTFGCWRGGGDHRELVPVAKAPCGCGDSELRRIEAWVGENTTERFGPVYAVQPGLVAELAFDSVQRSPRRKSGLVLRAARIHRIRWDHPADAADELATLERLLGQD